MGFILQLLPLLLQGLKLKDSTVVQETVETLETLLSHSPEEAVEHTGSLIPSLVNLTTNMPLVSYSYRLVTDLY